MPNPKATSLSDAFDEVLGPKPSPALDAAFTEVLGEKPFIPATAGDFVKRLGDAAVDVPVGMVKQAGRYAQMIPGVAAATDAVYGLPAGASKQSMQATNPNQQAGGVLTDLALGAAGAAAEAGPAVLSRTAGYISNPTVAERAITSAKDAAAFGGDVMNALKSKVASGGGLTADKVASLIATYGKQAAKGAITGAFGYGAYKAFENLF